MQQYEQVYAALLRRILADGEVRRTRNGITKSLFGESLQVPLTHFPLIQGRKMFPRGVLGEFAAMIRRPTCVEDFERWGCNYWSNWADPQGNLNVDYGNAWFDFNGFDQIAALKCLLKLDPTSRRMIVSSWRPEKLAELSLPCCHYSYQFYVREGIYLDMIWTQRSVDMMVGRPSDIVLGAIWVITLANEFGMLPGNIKFDLGDCHIYEEHWDQTEEYCEVVETKQFAPVDYLLFMAHGADFCTFEPERLHLAQYKHGPTLNLLLKE